MKQFELQKPISQLLNVLKCHLLACELISDRNVLNNLIKPIILEKDHFGYVDHHFGTLLFHFIVAHASPFSYKSWGDRWVCG